MRAMGNQPANQYAHSDGVLTCGCTIPRSQRRGAVMNADKILVPITDEDLTMLEWFAAWTPEVHRANWMVRRTWPPGFREIADTSVRGYHDANQVAARKADPPIAGGRSFVPRLLAYRLVEG